MTAKIIWTRIRMWLAILLVTISIGAAGLFSRWDIGAWFGIWAVLFILIEAFDIILVDMKRRLKDEIKKG